MHKALRSQPETCAWTSWRHADTFACAALLCLPHPGKVIKWFAGKAGTCEADLEHLTELEDDADRATAEAEAKRLFGARAVLVKDLEKSQGGGLATGQADLKQVMWLPSGSGREGSSSQGLRLCRPKCADRPSRTAHLNGLSVPCPEPPCMHANHRCPCAQAMRLPAQRQWRRWRRMAAPACPPGTRAHRTLFHPLHLPIRSAPPGSNYFNGLGTTTQNRTGDRAGTVRTLQHHKEDAGVGGAVKAIGRVLGYSVMRVAACRPLWSCFATRLWGRMPSSRGAGKGACMRSRVRACSTELITTRACVLPCYLAPAQPAHHRQQASICANPHRCPCAQAMRLPTQRQWRRWRRMASPACPPGARPLTAPYFTHLTCPFAHPCTPCTGSASYTAQQRAAAGLPRPDASTSELKAEGGEHGCPAGSELETRLI